MGWVKRDSDVRYVRGQHSAQCKLMDKLTRRMKNPDAVPEEIERYIKLSHMVGQYPDHQLIQTVLSKFALALPMSSWRRA